MSKPLTNNAFLIITQVARVILGLIFFIFGLNGFFHFIPIPPATGIAGEFILGLTKAPYFYPFMMFIEVATGFLLLSGLLVPVAIVLLFPITLNIFFYHLMLPLEGFGISALVMTTHILLFIKYWPVYKPIFNIPNAWKSRPSISTTLK